MTSTAQTSTPRTKSTVVKPTSKSSSKAQVPGEWKIPLDRHKMTFQDRDGFDQVLKDKEFLAQLTSDSFVELVKGEFVAHLDFKQRKRIQTSHNRFADKIKTGFQISADPVSSWNKFNDNNELTQEIILNDLRQKEIVTTKGENKDDIQEETKENDKKEDNDEIKDKTEEKDRKGKEDKAVQCDLEEEEEKKSSQKDTITKEASSLKRKSGMMTDPDDSASSESLKKMKMTEDSSQKESTPDKEAECTHCIQVKKEHEQLRKGIRDERARLLKEKQDRKIKVQSQKISAPTKEIDLIRKLPNSQRTAKENSPEDDL